MRTPSALVADRIHRRYVDKTLVLATEFETPGGRLTLTDPLAVGPNERGVSSAPRPGAVARRLYVVSIEGNVVRLAFDAPPEVKVTREELLPEEARRRWTEDRGEPVTPPRFERDRRQGCR